MRLALACLLLLAACHKQVDTAPIQAEAAGLTKSENELLERSKKKAVHNMW